MKKSIWQKHFFEKEIQLKYIFAHIKGYQAVSLSNKQYIITHTCRAIKLSGSLANNRFSNTQRYLTVRLSRKQYIITYHTELSDSSSKQNIVVAVRRVRGERNGQYVADSPFHQSE
jgi:hypothetical protein